MKVVRIELDEFELEDGSVYPIIPPLREKMPLEDFQKIYDKSYKFIESLKNPRS